MKGINQPNKWRDIPCPLIQRVNTIKMIVFPNSIYRCNIIQTEIPTSCFGNIDKLILKYIWRSKRPRMANIPLKENSTVRGLTLPDCTTYCKTTVIKIVQYW